MSLSSRYRMCYMGCEKYTRLFAFPKDEQSRLVWLKALGRENEFSYYGRSKLKLCDRHFSRKMLTPLGRRLLEWAVPDVPPGLEEYNVKNREILSAEQDMIHEVPTKQQLKLMHEFIKTQDLQKSSELSQLTQSPMHSLSMQGIQLIEHTPMKQIPPLDIILSPRAEMKQEPELILDDESKNDEKSLSEIHENPCRLTDSSATDTETEISVSSSKRTERKRRRRTEYRPYLTEKLSRILETHLNSGDEYDYFFKNMTFRVRKLRSDKARSCVQKIFSNVLFDAEMGKYDDGMPNGFEIYSNTFPLVDIKSEPVDN